MKNQVNIDKNSGPISITDAQGVQVNIHTPKIEIPQALTPNLPILNEPDRIIGRGKDLDDVRDLLEKAQKVVVVNGLGGIGKTTLAQAYLTRYKADYVHLLWMTQSDGNNFLLDLITAPGLTQSLGIHTEGRDANAIFMEVQHAIHRITDKPNLLVIDNANATLHKHFAALPKPPNWHILATSRERIEHFTTKDLGFLGEESALLLFQQHCTRITDEAAIRSILKTIDYHTLTIELLAKTAQRNDTPVSTLQKAIEDDLKAGVYIQHKGDKIERVTSYLLSIFDLNPLSAEEQRLLQHFAALPTEFIPYDWLKELIPAEEGIAAILQDLSDKGWLLKQTEPESYKIHRIIQEVVRKKLPPTVALLHNFIDKVSIVLSTDQTKDNPVDKFPLIPFGEAVLEVFPDSTDAVMSRLQNNLALVLKDFGDYKTAKNLLEKVVHSDEANFGKKHPTTAEHYSNLAIVLKDLGDYAAAKNLLTEALRSDEANFGEMHPETAKKYSNLALVLKDLGDYEKAKNLLEKVVHSDEATYGETHPATAMSYSNLAVVLRSLGDYEKAKKLLEKAVHTDEASFGEIHPETATKYSNLAVVLKDLGDYATAKILLEKAMRSDEANFGEMHPSTAVRYFNLATVYYQIKEYELALVLVSKAYRIYAEQLGQQHPHTKDFKYGLNGLTNEMLQNGYTEEEIREMMG